MPLCAFRIFNFWNLDAKITRPSRSINISVHHQPIEMTRLISNTRMLGGDWLHVKEIDCFHEDDHLHISDVFSDEWLCKLLLAKGKPSTIFLDSYTAPVFDTAQDLVRGIDFFCAEVWLENQCQIFDAASISRELETKFTANLICNRKNINRYLALKLCELHCLDINYTWSGFGREFDLGDIMQDLNALDIDVKTFMLKPISLPQRWIDVPEQQTNGIQFFNNELPRLHKWTVIQDICTPTAISIVTESVGHEKRMQFSEKTLFSVLSLTVPLWVGGFRQAHWWSTYGFDTFDDVIDHSYQDHDALLSRCWHAFRDNLDLLRNLDRCQELRHDLRHRLLTNRQRLRWAIAQRNDEIMQQWPGRVRQIYSPIINLLRSPQHTIQ